MSLHVKAIKTLFDDIDKHCNEGQRLRLSVALSLLAITISKEDIGEIVETYYLLTQDD